MLKGVLHLLMLYWFPLPLPISLCSLDCIIAVDLIFSWLVFLLFHPISEFLWQVVHFSYHAFSTLEFLFYSYLLNVGNMKNSLPMHRHLLVVCLKFFFISENCLFGQYILSSSGYSFFFFLLPLQDWLLWLLIYLSVTS